MVVPLLLDLLGRHVVRSAHVSVREHRLIAHYSTESEVTELHVARAVDEHVAGFEIPVQNFSFLSTMALEKCQVHLSKNLPSHFFRYELLRLLASLDQGSHVSLLAEFHNDVDATTLLVDDSIVVANDVRMAQVTKNVDL